MYHSKQYKYFIIKGSPFFVWVRIE